MRKGDIPYLPAQPGETTAKAMGGRRVAAVPLKARNHTLWQLPDGFLKNWISS
jgi:hypothetical protein